MKPAAFSAKVKAVAPSCLTIGASSAEGARGLILARGDLPCTLSPDFSTSSLKILLSVQGGKSQPVGPNASGGSDIGELESKLFLICTKVCTKNNKSLYNI